MLTKSLEKLTYTCEQYLALEEKSTDKHEYINGEIIIIPGTTTNHNKIAGNFYKNFPLTLNNQNYDIYMSDVKLWIPQYNIYTYPDVMIIRGNPVYEGEGKITVTNPLIIVEVLSKSTSNYDQTDKFRFYRSLSELREYILIDQYSFYVEQFIKQSRQKWILNEYEGEDAILSLDSIDWQISLKDIYHRVDFDS